MLSQEVARFVLKYGIGDNKVVYKPLPILASVTLSKFSQDLSCGLVRRTNSCVEVSSNNQVIM